MIRNPVRGAARALASALHRAAYALWARYPAQLPAGPRPPCITVKVDGPLHVRDRGWQGGAMYGDIAPGARDALLALMADGYAVVARSQRTDQKAVAAWLEQHGVPAVADTGEPRAYWTDTTRVLCTPRALTSPIEVTPYGYSHQDWSTTTAHIRETINRPNRR
ncbi:MULTISPECIES: hypothetical protein [Streptomyces]|uniref:hypothetical protein n=2 Tax=Streptomyces TaxID=1883 RepID=UPI00103FF69F|nr:MULTISPECIES: hypothetical protein [Streptomyces]MBT3077600.1 hypothetical protein [Streptomyces sp. COG21]MBT3084446.1 hypothetical protein [Streptomyces sp. COG20]MBT3085353.1 hypothetical protein [Streptomyces sp. CYG21]MBT3095927.1 hypothetical protein [Streptomyces sp. CBG30]MBT3103604.1 hypothetical protein [Streptomyces sp. COG19]